MLENYFIEQISYSQAMQIVIEHHYLHRKAPCSMAFGLFHKNDPHNCLGVVIYGTPVASTLRKGICGLSEALNVYELTRLWVDDSVPKNGESFLIGNTLRLLDKEIIVSFADKAENHVGIVYQATNWIYTGLSAKRTDWTVEGINKHGHTWADKYKADEMRSLYGDKFTLVERSRKHRYVFFNATKKRKKELLNLLRYKIESYPKSID
jgi:hypothetical protein